MAATLAPRWEEGLLPKWIETEGGKLTKPGAHDGLAESPRVAEGRRFLGRARGAGSDRDGHLDHVHSFTRRVEDQLGDVELVLAEVEPLERARRHRPVAGRGVGYPRAPQECQEQREDPDAVPAGFRLDLEVAQNPRPLHHVDIIREERLHELLHLTRVVLPVGVEGDDDARSSSEGCLVTEANRRARAPAEVPSDDGRPQATSGGL